MPGQVDDGGRTFRLRWDQEAACDVTGIKHAASRMAFTVPTKLPALMPRGSNGSGVSVRIVDLVGVLSNELNSQDRAGRGWV